MVFSRDLSVLHWVLGGALVGKPWLSVDSTSNAHAKKNLRQSQYKLAPE